MYELYEQGMYQVAYGVLHNKEQAEDAVQDSFEKLFEYSDAIVQAFRKFRAPCSGKIVHTFPEQSAVIQLVLRWNLYSMFCQKRL